MTSNHIIPKKDLKKMKRKDLISLCLFLQEEIAEFVFQLDTIEDELLAEKKSHEITESACRACESALDLYNINHNTSCESVKQV